MNYPFADLPLARRLENAEASANAAFVEARAALHPESRARWIEVAGARCMFDGPDSPISQVFGLGLFDEVTTAHLDQIEAFFRSEGCPCDLEISPLVGPAFSAMLAERGYVPVEHSSMTYQPIRWATMRTSDVGVRIADRSEARLWAETSAKGWSDHVEAETFLRQLGHIVATREGSVPFFAELDGRPIATGALLISDRVALFSGASTMPAFRGRGAQRALLNARLTHAAKAGCDLAVMVTLPGSTSQRNAERAGFRIAYTRTKWRKDPA